MIKILLNVMISCLLLQSTQANSEVRSVLNKRSLFDEIHPDDDFDAGNEFFYDYCPSSLEIPLWENPQLLGEIKAYKAIHYNLDSSRVYDKKSERDFKYEFQNLTNDEFASPLLKKQWYTHGFLNGQPLFEDQTDALKRKTESWPIRALVIARTRNIEIEGKDGIALDINTLIFDEKGNVIDGVNPKVKKRMGVACSSLFLIDKKTLESSIGSIGFAFSYYAHEQRVCHFFPKATLGAWWATAGNLEDHRKMLLTRCKSPFYIPLEPDGSNQAEVEESEKREHEKHLQSVIPSELDLNKPIESNNFILTVRFSDPVKPVYHASLPNVCLVDCPNTGAKQIEGLELKIKPIETKKNRRK